MHAASILIVLLITSMAHGLSLSAVCVNDNTDLMSAGGRQYLMVGDTVTIVEISGDTVLVKYNGNDGKAGAVNFKIDYAQGLSLVAATLQRECAGDQRLYTSDDLRTSPEVLLFLGNSFGYTYADILRNEIFARHGDVFESKLYCDLFGITGWYQSKPGFNVLMLNGYEQANIKWLKSSKQTRSGQQQQHENGTVAISKTCVDNVDTLLLSGLVAYYPFNGDPLDRSGNNHHGIPSEVRICEDRFRKAKKAYYFNGNRGYIQLPSAAELELCDRSFSVSVWVNGQNLENDIQDHSILGMDTPANSGCLTLLIRHQKPLLAFYFNDTYANITVRMFS